MVFKRYKYNRHYRTAVKSFPGTLKEEFTVFRDLINMDYLNRASVLNIKRHSVNLNSTYNIVYYSYGWLRERHKTVKSLKIH
jgi:hypothetical protein